MIPWMGIYSVGLIIGLTGLMSLVRSNWDNSTIRGLTYSLFFVPLFVALSCGVLALLAAGSELSEDLASRLMLSVALSVFSYVGTLMVLLSFCTDWILAVMAHNYTGYPEGEVEVIYWIYFAAKRLPLFAF